MLYRVVAGIFFLFFITLKNVFLSDQSVEIFLQHLFHSGLLPDLCLDCFLLYLCQMNACECIESTGV